MSDASVYRSTGFDFLNYARNSILEKKGVPLSKVTRTGIDIVGCIFKDGVVLGADTRATEGDIVKNGEKATSRLTTKLCVPVAQVAALLFGFSSSADLLWLEGNMYWSKQWYNTKLAETGLQGRNQAFGIDSGANGILFAFDLRAGFDENASLDVSPAASLMRSKFSSSTRRRDSILAWLFFRSLSGVPGPSSI
ncbi:PUP1_2 [Sanghuangporus weigelae]